MWPFKKKEKKWKPKSNLDYFLLGVAHSRELKKKYPKPKQPIYTPPKIIIPPFSII